MPHYKLSYFAMMGRAEPIRWMFAYANQEYEDERWDREAVWPNKKPETPFGKLPILHVDGKYISSSTAIGRYLAKSFGLMPEDAMQQAVCDEVVDGLNDSLLHVRNIMLARKAGNMEEVEKLGNEYVSTVFPPIGKALEDLLQNNKWFGGNKVAWADFFIAFFLDTIGSKMPQLLNNCPKLKALVANVLALPAVAKWIKERPVTAM